MAEVHRGRHRMAGNGSEEVTKGRLYEVIINICGRWHVPKVVPIPIPGTCEYFVLHGVEKRISGWVTVTQQMTPS